METGRIVSGRYLYHTSSNTSGNEYSAVIYSPAAHANDLTGQTGDQCDRIEHQSDDTQNFNEKRTLLGRQCGLLRDFAHLPGLAKKRDKEIGNTPEDGLNRSAASGN